MTERCNFDEILNRQNTDSLKWDWLSKFLPEAPEGALPLWVADMDFPVAEPILQALRTCLDRQVFGYSYYRSDAYLDAVTGWFKRRFDWSITPESIYYSPGVVPAIAALIRILTEPGDSVIIQRPVYYPFTDKIINNGRNVVNNPLKLENNRYEMDFEDLEEKLKAAKTKGLILCSPHNPVGRVWEPDTLKRVVELCKAYDKWIISDEIHGDLTRKNIRHFPLEALCPDYKDKIITCTAPSKTFNLAGLHLSNIILNDPALRKTWSEEVDGRLSIGMASPFAIVSAIAAYNQGEAWLAQLSAYLDDNIEFVKEYFKNQLPEAIVHDTEGTYLVWVDLRRYENDPVKLEALMLKEAKVALDEGYFFGPEGNGFERINVACPRATLKEALDRMTNSLLK
jgi:cystathionine beta-lyase